MNYTEKYKIYVQTNSTEYDDETLNEAYVEGKDQALGFLAMYANHYFGINSVQARQFAASTLDKMHRRNMNSFHLGTVDEVSITIYKR